MTKRTAKLQLVIDDHQPSALAVSIIRALAREQARRDYAASQAKAEPQPCAQ